MSKFARRYVMKENSIIIREIHAICDLVRGSNQESYYQRILKDAKPIEISPIDEVLTTEQINLIRSVVNPKPKECYKNATLACYAIDGCNYVEGKMTIYKGFVTEHAWNKVGDKYIDITMELALNRNPKEEEYAALGEYDIKEVEKIILKQGFYGDIYREMIINEIFDK